MKLILYTILVIFLNMILILLISNNFRDNFFGYLNSLNNKAQLLGKSAYETIYKSSDIDSTSDTEIENKAMVSHQKPILKHSSNSLPKKNNDLNEVDKEKSVTNNLDEPALKEQNEEKTNQQFQIVDDNISLLSGNDGFIFIESSPEKVSVVIEGKEIGQTPVTLRVNPPGIYKVVLKSKDYETWAKTVHVYPSEVTKINAKLIAGSSTLTILSDPQMADIRIDGDYKGKTPLTVKSITAGTHQIYIAKGNKEYEGEIDILSEENKVINVTLSVLKALVKVDSEPKGANIYIDGINYGETPAELKDVKIGNRQIVLVHGDDLAFVDSIDIYPEQENTFFAKLIDKIHFKDIFSANLKIESDLEEAIVRIDGRTCGIIPLVLNNVRSGEHEVFLVKSDQKGTYYFSTRLSINPYETKEISVMTKDFEFKRRFE